jgi:hypothetical protein
MTIKTHAKLSASSSDRWMNCPGSIQLSEKAPPQVESAYAAEGTLAHECLEILLTTPSEIPVRFTEEMHNYAKDAVETIFNMTPLGAEIIAEQKVDLSFIEPDMFGTLDCAIIEHFGTLKIIDYKYGAGYAVSPVGNSQLLYYALGIAHLYDYNFKDIELVIIQPRAFYPDGRVRSWKCSMDYLHKFAEILIQAVQRTKEERPPINPGNWCKWCPAAVICPALKDQALAEAKIEFSNDLTEVMLPEPEEFDIPDLSAMLLAADKIEVWIEKIRAYAFGRLSQGKEVPGFKLVEKRSIRKWNDLEYLETRAYANFGEKAFERSLLSPAQLEKKIPDAKEFIKENTVNVSSGLTMALVTDKRLAVNQLSAKDSFSQIEEKGESMAKKMTGKAKPKTKPKK